MRKYPKGLQNLRKISFSRDTYESRWSSGDDYYEILIPLSGAIPEDLEARAALEPNQTSGEIWEREHRQRILEEADDYVRMFPKLERMYFGQIPMFVTNFADSHGRKAAVLSQERDSCWTLLRRIFGRPTTDS